MDRKSVFTRVAVVIFFIFILNFLAGKFYWYYTVWYFDILMHILGGFFIALILFWIFRIKKINFEIIIKIILGVFVIGVGWEIFEIIFNNIIAQEQFVALDTISDIFCDLTGACLAIIYFFKKSIISEKNKL